MFGNVNSPGLANVQSLRLDKAIIYLISGGNEYRGEFKSTETYAEGDVIIADTGSGPRFMQATEAISAGAFDANKWTTLTLSNSGSGSGSTASNVTMLVYNESTGEYEETYYSNLAPRIALESETDGSFVEPSWSGTSPITEVYDESTDSWSTV